MITLWVALAVFAVAVVVALATVAPMRPVAYGVAKPLATLSLIGVAGFPAQGPVSMLVAAGLLVAAIADLVLVSDARPAFLAGLALFLLTHVLYLAAFVAGAGWAAPAWLAAGAGLYGVASGFLLARLWPGIDRGLRMPVAAYSAIITLMAAAALATLGGIWPWHARLSAALGAALFFASDSTLAWNRFGPAGPRRRHATLVLYWVGQLGIALAARWAPG